MVRARFLLVKLAQFDRKMSFHFPRVFGCISTATGIMPVFGLLGGNLSGLGTRGSRLGLAGSINSLLLLGPDYMSRAGLSSPGSQHVC